MIFTPAVRPEAVATDLAWWFAFVDGKLAVPDDAPTALAPMSGEALMPALSSRHYLGRLGGHDCWALRLTETPPGWRALPLRAAMMALAEPLAGLAGRAAQVLEWDRAHRYCGVCGSATEIQVSERSRICPVCRHTVYPRLSPAMMALVWRPGEVLLARSPHYTPGMYSALAGFVEAGESLEDCVVREIAEEVGVAVKNLRYFGSQSWPFPHSLMVAFTAEWASGEIVPQAGEIEAADWFALDALPGIPPLLSISGHLIRDTVAAMRR